MINQQQAKGHETEFKTFNKLKWILWYVKMNAWDGKTHLNFQYCSTKKILHINLSSSEFITFKRNLGVNVNKNGIVILLE